MLLSVIDTGTKWKTRNTVKMYPRTNTGKASQRRVKSQLAVSINLESAQNNYTPVLVLSNATKEPRQYTTSYANWRLWFTIDHQYRENWKSRRNYKYTKTFLYLLVHGRRMLERVSWKKRKSTITPWGLQSYLKNLDSSHKVKKTRIFTCKVRKIVQTGKIKSALQEFEIMRIQIWP